MAILVTDYVDIIEGLVKLATDNGVSKDLVDDFFKQQALTRNFMSGKHGTYAELVIDMPRMDLVFRIERKNDVHTIANKTLDFSITIIKQLIKEGYDQAMDQGTKILQMWILENPDQKIK